MAFPHAGTPRFRPCSERPPTYPCSRMKHFDPHCLLCQTGTAFLNANARTQIVHEDGCLCDKRVRK